MFDKLLVANRGEIACRILGTARKLGLRTVAVYSEADAASAHVSLADEALLVGPAPAAESYLRIDRILEAARRSQAGAIHPGYGFLAENPEFAEACAAGEIIFVGPPAEAMRAMGSKVQAKRLMSAAGVPVVPGYHGDEREPQALLDAAREIGFPVLIKASAGGGGKGMRIVHSAAEFARALASAQREARNAFGDDRVLLERYLDRPRHIEVQVFADAFGNVVHLYERDCSMQRRHQKVVEEAPAPALADGLRAALGEAASQAARAIGYRGAGTVEFILDQGGEFYFMEMNTRLQVEHPVTEMVTGLDLVEWQLKVAAGEPLPLRQDQIVLQGHAIEARLYAEDPARDFLPAPGRLAHLRFPVEDNGLRIDSGVREGDLITVHYDPMIAKVIARGDDRRGACRRLLRALVETRLAGVASNLDFLINLVGSEAFAAGRYDTAYIDRHREQLLGTGEPDETLLCVAGLKVVLDRAAQAGTEARASDDPFSPWALCDGWRLNGAGHETIDFGFGGVIHRVDVGFRPGGYTVVVAGRSFTANAWTEADGSLIAILDGLRLRAGVIAHGDDLRVTVGDRSIQLHLEDPLAAVTETEAGAGTVTAPMPGRLVKLMVTAGASVTQGEPLLVLEAMKMEHTLTAPADGRVAAIFHIEGDQVDEGAELISFETDG